MTDDPVRSPSMVTLGVVVLLTAMTCTVAVAVNTDTTATAVETVAAAVAVYSEASVEPDDGDGAAGVEQLPDAVEPPPDPGTSQGDRPERGPPGSGIPAPGALYSWPLYPPPEVLVPFRAPAHPYGPGHRGVDLAAHQRQPVLAAGDGVVMFAGPVGGRGVVSVEHDGGLRTTYEPLRPTVARGDRVRRGDVIGFVDGTHSGCASSCLHWGVHRDRLTYLDPLMLVRPACVRLLPAPEPWPQ